MSVGIEPKHKLTSKEKLDTDYIDNVVRYYVQQANLLGGEKTKLQILYDAVEGKINEESYRYVLNRYNTDNKQLTKFPARLRNYDIISPVIKLWLGEQSRKPKGGTVIATEADSENKRKQFIADGVKQSMFQDFVNHLNNMGIDTQMMQQEVEKYQQQANRLNQSYDDVAASTGQEALDYLKYYLNLDDVAQKLLFDFVVTGRYISYKDVYLNDVVYEACDPRDVTIVGWGKTDYAEDADAAIRVRNLSSNAILDLFQDEIQAHEKSEEIVEWLDSKKDQSPININVVELQSENIDRNTTREDSINESYNTNLIKVYHITWKSFTKVGMLHYYNQLGEIEKLEVDDTYKLNKTNGDIKIDWFWINEVWEAYQFEDSYILGGRPIPVQRNQLNNLSECKLPYNGRILGYRNSEIVSPVNDGLDFQVLFNIFHYRFELLLAKNKDKLLAFPLGLIPDGGGWDTDKFMYWMAADGLLMYDDSKPKVAALLNGIKSIDLSMGNYMESMWKHMYAIKEEWWEFVGMNRQRYGDTFASDGKGNNEQAIFRSNILTADMFRQFDKGYESDLRGILDYSKVAWLDGKKGMYINSDRRKAFLNLTADDMLVYQSTDFGVFVSNRDEEYEQVAQAKNLLQTMGQNGLDSKHLMGILSANNMAKIMELAETGTAIEREFQQQQSQAQNEAMLKAEEMRNQRDNAKNETQIIVADKKAAADIEVALINADASLVDILNNTTQLEEDTVAGDAISGAVDRLAERQQNRKEQSEVLKAQQNKENMQFQREKMMNDLAIAKENKNRYDKK